MSDQDTPSQHRLSDAVLAFVTGTFLALVLLSYLFMVEAHLSSTASTFFTLVFSWLVGFLVGLHLKSTPARFYIFLVAGTVAYYVARLLLWHSPHNLYLLPALAVCVALSGVVAGNFFPWVQHRFPRIKYLLLYENNGFILGLAVALCGSIFAGVWLLDFAPVIGLVPITATLVYQKYTASRTPSSNIEVVRAPLLVASDHMFPLFVSGLHFGILLICLYLTLQMFVSASFVTLLVVGVAWILGIILNMKFAVPRSLSASMGVSISSYYVLLMATSVFTPYEFLLPVFAILIVLVALPAGSFFREYASRFSSSSTFLHQNNGLVLGYILSLFGFAEWGVKFLYWAPLLSYAIAFLGQSRRSFPAYTCMLIIAFLCIEMDSPETFWTLAIAVTMGGACFFWRHGMSLSLSHSKDATGTHPPSPGSATDQIPAWAGKAILVVAGLNTMQLYFFVSRDFSALLGPGEMSCLLITAAYLTGLSVGYGASRFFSLALVRALAPMVLVTHLILAVFTRVIVGAMISRGLEVEVLFGLLFVTAFCTAAFFAMILPKLVDHMESGSLISAYSWNLVGVAGGIAGLFVLLQWLPVMLWPCYFVTMLVLVLLLVRRTGWMIPSLVVGAFTIGLFTNHQGDLMRHAAEDYYEARSYENPRVVFRGNSFHHSLEVIETFPDNDRETASSRITFLDGVERFRYETGGEPHHPDPSELTYFLAELPAKYLFAEKGGKLLRILILGGGPSDAAFRVRDYAAQTTVVEIDRLVTKSANTHWSHVTQHKLVHNLEVVVDDPPHYLKTVPEKFDLIINHAGPLDGLDTVLLHGQHFYELVRSRLKTGGIFVEPTGRRPLPGSHDDLAMRIFRSVAEAFPRYRLIETHGSATRRGSGYLYASESLNLSSEELPRIIREDGLHEDTRTHRAGCDHFRLYKVVPLSSSNMDALFASSGNTDAASAETIAAKREAARSRGFFRSLWDDSRLVHTIVGKAKERRFAILVAAVLLVAAAAKVLTWWSSSKKPAPSFVIHTERRRRRRRRRRSDTSQTKSVDRV